MDITGRTAIITGGAEGLGRATVQRFAEAGASGIVIADIKTDEAQAAAKQVMAEHDVQAIAVTTDVSDPAQVDEMVQTAADRLGRIDILVSNAGICPLTEWDDVTLENWNQILGINLTGMLLCTRAAIKHMRAQGDGRIVYVSSPAAYVGSIIAHVGYGVSKAGVIALMKSVAKKFAAEGIRANAIAPGPIDTPMGRTFSAQYWEATQEKTVLKRHATATEIADSILYLASDRSSYVTGEVLFIDGGWNLT